MHAARLMTLHAAWKMDQVGASASRDEIAMIKYYGADVLHNVIDRAIQVYGSLGYSTGHAARGDVPRGASGAHLRRAGRSAPSDRRAPRARRTTNLERYRATTYRRARLRRESSSPTSWSS